MSDGQREQQAPKSARGDGAKNQSKSGSQLPLPSMIGSSPLMTAAAITRKILGAPLVTSKDAPYPTNEDYATGGCEEKWARIEGLAVLVFKKTNKSLGLVPPSTADKAVCTSPIFSVGATSKRPAISPPATHATPKRRAATAASRQIDENNNNVVDQDQDGFVLVDHRRHRHCNQPATTVGSARPRQQPKPRPAKRRVHHRPDAIVIRAKDATTYADILRIFKADAALQQSVGSSVQNIRRSAAGALVLQLRKGVENAPSLGAEVDKVLGDVATASAIQHTSMVEIRDFDECATRTEIAEELARSLGAPHLNEEGAETRPHTDWLGQLPNPWSRGGRALLPLLEPWSCGRSLLGSRLHGALPSTRPEGPSGKGLQRPTSVRSLPDARS
uniref:Uncharacterized protein n=1 Tax=Trichogramma kaykai TaxID=54128 RepID=A0ABD2WFG1_9HYME